MLIFLATVSIAVALLYPAWSGRAFRERVATARADVELLGTAARSLRDRTGRWPTAASPGSVPEELRGGGAQDSVFTRPGYTLEWTSWHVIDSIEVVDNDPPPAADDAPSDTVPPPLTPIVRALGAIRVHSADSALLAELLEGRSGSEAFVVDTTFVLLLPERAAAPPRR